MKKLNILLLLSILSAIQATAQWNSSGANIYNSNGGNVGIGLNAPGAKLHVLGVGDVNKDFLVNGRMQSGDANNNGGVWFGTDDKTFVGRTLANVGFYNNGAWRLLVDASGNTGIGTVSPTQKLDVIGSIVSDNLALSRNNTSRGSIWFGSVGDVNHRLYNNSGNLDGQGAFDGIKWNVNAGINIRTGLNGQTSAFNIISNGNVGIGTVNPTEKLEVAGNIKSNGIKIGTGPLITNLTPSQWVTNGNDITYNNGNVGIGTISPSEKLEVAGSIKANGLILPKGMISEPSFWENHSYTINEDKFQCSHCLFNSDQGGWACDYYISNRNESATINVYEYIQCTDVVISNEVEVVKTNKNVGIGIDNPVQKLEIAGGAMKAYYNPGQVSKVQIDDIKGSLGNNGIVENNAGDLHLRGFWGVVIDKNGGNLGESGSYNNGVNPAGGSFAIRTRTGTSSFRTDFIVRNNGYVGIGTISPSEKLDVSGNIKITGTSNVNYIQFPDNTKQYTAAENYWTKSGSNISYGSGNVNLTGSNREILFSDNGQIRSLDNNHRILFRRSENKMELREAGDIVFSPGATAGNETAKIIMRADGALVVKKRIDAPEFRACLNAGSGDCPPDYVFESDYKLMGLDTLKAYLAKNKHLPEVPSAKEMLSNGLDMKAMNMTLLKKVEELTLYILKQEEELKDIKLTLSKIQK